MDLYFVTREKEEEDIQELVELVKKESIVGSDTILINCSPEYSSRLVQSFNHKVSHINDNELLEVINLEIPRKGKMQVWDSYESQFCAFDRYLYDWTNRYITSDFNYLFLTTSVTNGKNLTKIKRSVKSKSNNKINFVSLYRQDTSLFVPDYTIRVLKNQHPVFSWENTNLK